MYSASTLFKKLCMNNMPLTPNPIWSLTTFPNNSNNMAVLRSREVRVIVAPLKHEVCR